LYAPLLFAQTTEKEANLKAAFIYNFTEYIDWQTSNNSGDFVIGVIGNSPLSASLKEIAARNRVKNKRIIVKTFDQPSEIEFCNILFIPKNSNFSLKEILKNTSPGMLTISEEEGYGEMGTGFNFLIRNNKLKFEANLKALARSDLKVSSQLLKLAIIVN
jgi:hypothetical protein